MPIYRTISVLAAVACLTGCTPPAVMMWTAPVGMGFYTALAVINETLNQVPFGEFSRQSLLYCFFIYLIFALNNISFEYIENCGFGKINSGDRETINYRANWIITSSIIINFAMTVIIISSMMASSSIIFGNEFRWSYLLYGSVIIFVLIFGYYTLIYFGLKTMFMDEIPAYDTETDGNAQSIWEDLEDFDITERYRVSLIEQLGYVSFVIAPVVTELIIKNAATPLKSNIYSFTLVGAVLFGISSILFVIIKGFTTPSQLKLSDTRHYDEAALYGIFSIFYKYKDIMLFDRAHTILVSMICFYPAFSIFFGKNFSYNAALFTFIFGSFVYFIFCLLPFYFSVVSTRIMFFNYMGRSKTISSESTASFMHRVKQEYPIYPRIPSVNFAVVSVIIFFASLIVSAEFDAIAAGQ